MLSTPFMKHYVTLSMNPQMYEWTIKHLLYLEHFPTHIQHTISLQMATFQTHTTDQLQIHQDNK